MAEAGGAHSPPAGIVPQAVGERSIQIQKRFRDPRPIPPHFQQPEGGSRFVNLPQHLPEKAFVLLPADPQPRLRDQIAEGQRPRQAVSLALQMRLDLLLQNLQRGVVRSQMMTQLRDHPTPALAIMRDEQPQQRSLAHIEPIMSWVDAFL